MLEFSFLSRDQIDTDHIETNRRRGLLRELPEISAREAAQDIALVVIHGHFGWSEIARGAGLHFDEAEHRSVPRDQVNVAR